MNWGLIVFFVLLAVTIFVLVLVISIFNSRKTIALQPVGTNFTWTTSEGLVLAPGASGTPEFYNTVVSTNNDFNRQSSPTQYWQFVPLSTGVVTIVNSFLGTYLAASTTAPLDRIFLTGDERQVSSFVLVQQSLTENSITFTLSTTVNGRSYGLNLVNSYLVLSENTNTIFKAQYFAVG